MKHRYVAIVWILLAAAIIIITACDTTAAGTKLNNDNDNTGGPNGSDLYQIGDSGPAGGLIFYIDEEDEHDWTYLEVAPESTEWESTEWGKAGIPVDGLSNTIGSGAENTSAIVALLNSGTPHFDKAAQRCDELSLNGFDDWFLPSRAELEAIWDNLVADGANENSDVGGFAEEIYWSSSQYNSIYAYGMYFDGTQLTYYSKASSYRVRAVRSF